MMRSLADSAACFSPSDVAPFISASIYLILSRMSCIKYSIKDVVAEKG